MVIYIPVGDIEACHVVKASVDDKLVILHAGEDYTTTF